ncbi:GRN [Lepeophtheirus salmonis]|uniref:GRN n=1 Tax=Lepeophtheirus salmonis TaxID=72036 RepID=A0A7R8H791_LEPSM|nr:GRN [Lepeophtheirus salmonis]CAF2913642.1 GRN [Lepeophtheirus salmonis]
MKMTFSYFAEGVKDCPGGTECPNGCCPIPNAFCCKDNMYCAIRPSDCPSKETRNAKKLLVRNEKEQCLSGIQCSGGCCPLEKAVCCQGSNFCASSLKDCPILDKSFKSSPLRQTKDLCPGGTECPSGCCPFEKCSLLSR